MKILVDTREQRPYWNINRTSLSVGDYTTDRLLNHYHIERKSLSDLYGTLTSGNNRFKAELFRAAYHQITIDVYVDGPKADFIAKNFPKGSERKFSSQGLERLITTFERKYYLKFYWHTSRARAKKAVKLRLEAMEATQKSKKS